jgi:chromosome partitioning protein
MRLRRRDRALEDDIADVPDEPEEPEEEHPVTPPPADVASVDSDAAPAAEPEPAASTVPDEPAGSVAPEADDGSVTPDVGAISEATTETPEPSAGTPPPVAAATVGPVATAARPKKSAPAAPAARPKKSAPAAKPAPATTPAKAPHVPGVTVPWDEEAAKPSAPTVRSLPRVMAVANQKGGVGKTTTTVNLGAALAELGYRVLVVDLDPQGNATTGLGIDARNFELSMYDVIMRDTPIEDCIEPTSVKNLFVAPATIDLAGVEIELVPAFSRELKLKKAIDSVVEDFDFVMIDCPPSLGLITVNGLAAASEVLVPIQCEYYALEGLSQLLRNVHLVASNLNSELEVSTIVLTMFDARTRLAIDVADEVRSHFADRVCRSVIPRTVRLSEAPSFGQPITVFDPSSRGAVAYRELAKEVSDGAPKRAG